MYPTLTPTQYRRAWEAAARADCAAMTNAELRAAREPLAYDLAEADAFDAVTREVVELQTGARLRMVDSELARRAALHARDAGLPDPHDERYEAWADLAREIREHADIVQWLQVAVGGRLRQTGAGEWHGPCPACGGADRFIAWPPTAGRPGRYWCRRCGLSGDVISAYRDLVVPGASFREAVGVLAAELGLRTPDFGSARPRLIDLGDLRGPIDLGELSDVG